MKNGIVAIPELLELNVFSFEENLLLVLGLPIVLLL